MRTHYGPWQPCWISNQHQKYKSGRGPSSEHFWQVWLKSVQWFQRRRFKCEKLTDGRRTLTHGLWPGELMMGICIYPLHCCTLYLRKDCFVWHECYSINAGCKWNVYLCLIWHNCCKCCKDFVFFSSTSEVFTADLIMS